MTNIVSAAQEKLAKDLEARKIEIVSRLLSRLQSNAVEDSKINKTIEEVESAESFVDLERFNNGQLYID